jgi:type I restriction enzyme S subunit
VNPSEIAENAWILDLEDIEKDTARLLQRVKKADRNTTSTRHRFEEGNVLYSKLRTYLNKVLVADEVGFCTTEILPLDFKGFVVSEYARRVLMSQMFLNYTEQCGYGVKMPRLGTMDGQKAPFPLPPLAEQCRIVSVVESAFALIDEIEDDKISLRQIVRQAKAKTLDLAARGKLAPRPAANCRLKNAKTTADNSPYAFEVPEGWKWCRIEQISLNVSAGGDKPNCYSNTKTDICKVPIFSNGIKDDGLYGYTDMPTITKPSITISARGTIGYTCIREEPYCPIVRLISITPDNNIVNIKFLNYSLQYLIPQGEGSSIPQLTVPNIKSKYIPLPPLAEQKLIVERIETIFNILNSIRENL